MGLAATPLRWAAQQRVGCRPESQPKRLLLRDSVPPRALLPQVPRDGRSYFLCSLCHIRRTIANDMLESGGA